MIREIPIEKTIMKRDGWIQVSSYHLFDLESGLRPIEEEIFEVLFDICKEKGRNERVKMKEILDRVENLNKAQLTNIIRRKLEPNDLIDYLPYEGILLTNKGYEVAKTIGRNHRLAEVLLGHILSMDWEFVHKEACHLEHGITDRIAEAILSKIDSDPSKKYSTKRST